MSPGPGVIIVPLISRRIETAHPFIWRCAGILAAYHYPSAIIWIVEVIPGIITIVITHRVIITETSIIRAVETCSKTNTEADSTGITIRRITAVIIGIIVVKIGPLVRILNPHFYIILIGCTIIFRIARVPGR